MKGQLGELEDAVMTRVWRLDRPVTVREVMVELRRERTIAYTTVMTVMDKVHRKGLLRRELDGRAYRYTAVATRADYAAALMDEAWSHGGRRADTLVAFLGRMTADQRTAFDEALRILGTRAEPPGTPP
ncbi:BlaI/MecI/CopY family transcriptional regulator [Streptomyces sp. NPDC006798]|uniref:BlaI/MecI/CopY family transcriptional regulator n=1 Tax=Streptomyces sp. NPDC006798 TaxID=3155462 RepID=UPI0034018D6A